MNTLAFRQVKQGKSEAIGSHSDSPVNFNGAALIDDNGREIPITEAMVQQACSSLEKS